MIFANKLIKPGYKYTNYQKQHTRQFQKFMLPNNGGNNDDYLLFIIIVTGYILFIRR